MSMNSFSDVIDALGVPKASEILGIPENHVRTLKARNSIPAGYFKRLVDSQDGRDVGLSFDLLYRLHDEMLDRRGKPSSSPEKAA